MFLRPDQAAEIGHVLLSTRGITYKEGAGWIDDHLIAFDKCGARHRLLHPHKQ